MNPKTQYQTWMRLCSLILLVIPSLFADPEPPRKISPTTTAAILDFQVSLGDKEGNSGLQILGKPNLTKDTGKDVAVLLNAKLSESPNLILVERQEIDKALSEIELSFSGLVTPDSAARVGNLIGAKVLVTGRVFESSKKIFIVSKVIGTETGRVYAETVTIPTMEDLEGGMQQMAQKVDAIVNGRYETLIAQVEDENVKIDRWKKLVEGKKLPVVAVSVSENHIRHPINDPAVETEIRHVLQKIGFTVVDQKESTVKPEILISGEAFSERGGQKGNLISCRSRVEIKMIKSSEGKLLLVDRQTDVAVDIAENIAAKHALENAAIKLLDRIIPKLVEKS
jgi:hypothetical protein